MATEPRPARPAYTGQGDAADIESSGTDSQSRRSELSGLRQMGLSGIGAQNVVRHLVNPSPAGPITSTFSELPCFRGPAAATTGSGHVGRGFHGRFCPLADI